LLGPPPATAPLGLGDDLRLPDGVPKVGRAGEPGPGVGESVRFRFFGRAVEPAGEGAPPPTVLPSLPTIAGLSARSDGDIPLPGPGAGLPSCPEGPGLAPPSGLVPLASGEFPRLPLGEAALEVARCAARE
jgi:hypothetical protein